MSLANVRRRASANSGVCFTYPGPVCQLSSLAQMWETKVNDGKATISFHSKSCCLKLYSPGSFFILSNTGGVDTCTDGRSRFTYFRLCVSEES